MRTINIKRLAALSVLGIAAVVGTSEASAQTWRSTPKQQQKITKQQQKLEKERLKLEQQRLKLERQRIQTAQNNNRYRVYRNGSYYNTDRRGADLLKQAVNEGYRQGYAAGRQDRNSRRNMGWNNSSIYRSGTYGYQSHVTRDQYQYYFRQGFERGYQDGYDSQTRYGYQSNNSMNILGTILNGILNLQQY